MSESKTDEDRVRCARRSGKSLGNLIRAMYDCGYTDKQVVNVINAAPSSWLEAPEPREGFEHGATVTHYASPTDRGVLLCQRLRDPDYLHPYWVWLVGWEKLSDLDLPIDKQLSPRTNWHTEDSLDLVDD